MHTLCTHYALSSMHKLERTLPGERGGGGGGGGGGVCMLMTLCTVLCKLVVHVQS